MVLLQCVQLAVKIILCIKMIKLIFGTTGTKHGSTITAGTDTYYELGYQTIVYPNYALVPIVNGIALGNSFSLSPSSFFYQTWFYAIRGIGGNCVACPGNCSHC